MLIVEFLMERNQRLHTYTQSEIAYRVLGAFQAYSLYTWELRQPQLLSLILVLKINMILATLSQYHDHHLEALHLVSLTVASSLLLQ